MLNKEKAFFTKALDNAFNRSGFGAWDLSAVPVATHCICQHTKVLSFFHEFVYAPYESMQIDSNGGMTSTDAAEFAWAWLEGNSPSSPVFSGVDAYIKWLGTHVKSFMITEFWNSPKDTPQKNYISVQPIWRQKTECEK